MQLINNFHLKYNFLRFSLCCCHKLDDKTTNNNSFLKLHNSLYLLFSLLILDI